MNVSKTIGRDLPNGAYIEITAEERGLHNTEGLSPGFAITGTVYDKHGSWDGRARKRNGRDMDAGGMMHEEILRAAPELAPLVTVHGSAPDGTPAHALANGWYFYSGAHEDYERTHYGQAYVDRHGTRRERAARCLHIPVDDLPEGLSKDGFRRFAEGLTDRWAEQASAARRVLLSLVDRDGVED